MRPIIIILAAFAAVGALPLLPARSADACAGLIGSNGAVNLGRTTTLAAYHDGVEHYVTAFQFQGGGGEFGALVPLPGIPTKVERGGGWTLQRLVRETDPVVFAARASGGDVAEESVEVIQQVRIDALDITILKGGGASVATWAEEHEFRLSPDAPEVLDFYARRSPIFLAAVFDGEAAAERGQQVGDGTPVHLTIPTSNPWVPLRILGLGKNASDSVEADVYLLTDREPALLPLGREGIDLEHSGRATKTLLNDLRADDGMGWVPRSAWLTKVGVNVAAGKLDFDLAVDASGNENPSPVAAGLTGEDVRGEGTQRVPWALAAISLAAFAMVGVLIKRPRTADS
jgi:hypothetical protein